MLEPVFKLLDKYDRLKEPWRFLTFFGPFVVVYLLFPPPFNLFAMLIILVLRLLHMNNRRVR